jgi:Transposase DDE domain
MISIQRTLATIFEKFDGINKPTRKFLTELFEIIPCVRGRLNFTNIGRYSKYNEVTLRRNFSKYFDWLKFNYLLIQFAVPQKKIVIGAIDCSYISKSGKHTYGVDKFWSGVANQAKEGLEISLVSVIDVDSGSAWSLDVRQTPAGLSKEEAVAANYTRIDFYMEQLADCIVQMPEIEYYTADGFYAKTKVLDEVCSKGKHLISKLRPDANLFYLLDKKKQPNAHGNRKYDSKVIWKALNLDKWNYEGQDEKYSHLRLYSQVLYSPQFKRSIKVVFVWNTKTNGHVLIFSTDITQEAKEIVSYYQLRFKIEFIFRDAKQFTGLNHCQARDEDKLDFHFNLSLAALNLYRFEAAKTDSVLSFNSLIRKAYNTKFVQILFDKLRHEPEFEGNFDIENPIIQDVINLGQMKA